jgi:hypothetical protein
MQRWTCELITTSWFTTTAATAAMTIKSYITSSISSSISSGSSDRVVEIHCMTEAVAAEAAVTAVNFSTYANM